MADETIDSIIFLHMKMRIFSALFRMLRPGMMIMKQIVCLFDHKSIDQEEGNDQCSK